jgi:hypothetical protein
MIENLEKALGLRSSEVSQLRAYIRWAEESGVYWKPENQFRKRHEHIKEVFGVTGYDD